MTDGIRDRLLGRNSRHQPQLKACLLPQHVNGNQLAIGFKMPEGPSIAGIGALHVSPHFVDRALGV